MVLGGDVPLEKDLLVKKIIDTQTFYEFISRQALVINRRANLTATGTTIIYTVPANKVFYLMTANLSSFCNGTGVAGASGGSTISTDQFSTILTLLDDRGIVSHQSTSTQFQYGLKFEQNENIILGTNVDNTSAFGSIQGFEVAKEISFKI